MSFFLKIKVLIFKRILDGKGGFLKIKGTICNILRETENICNILPRIVVSNGLIVFKLKRDVKCRSNVYFEPVRPHIVY